jgi:hypothetical protein
MGKYFGKYAKTKMDQTQHFVVVLGNSGPCERVLMLKIDFFSQMFSYTT